MLINNHIIQIEDTEHYSAPVNKSHRIQRELEEYFGIIFN
ncbi:hypothetical protein PPBDW_u10038 [Photobacterium kishitanii]|nr:hypothetical protein PPBDW_u10038 [Photobacterium kishitanii]